MHYSLILKPKTFLKKGLEIVDREQLILRKCGILVNISFAYRVEGRGEYIGSNNHNLLQIVLDYYWILS